MESDSTSSFGWWRVGGVSGIVFVVAFLIVIIIIEGNSPSIDGPIGELRDFYEDDTTLMVANWLLALLFVFFFLTFATALRSLLAAVDSDAGMWSRLSFVGSVIAVALGGAGSVYSGTLALGGANEMTDESLRSLVRQDALIFEGALPWALALMAAAAAVVILRSGVVWKWLGWLGLAAALVLVVGSLWIVDGDDEGALANILFIGLNAWVLWVLLTGVAMVRKANLVTS